MNKTSLDFPSGTVIAEAGIARKGSDPSYSAGPSSATTSIDGQVELVAAGNEAGEIRRAWQDAMLALVNGIRGVVICGGLLIAQKERVGHGAFLPWLEKNVPEIPARTAERWMFLASGLAARIKSATNGVFPMMAIHRLLQTPETEIPKEYQAARAEAMEFLAGKTQKELLSGLCSFGPDFCPGGDNEYLAFLREKHPELIGANGKTPKRTQELHEEFKKWQLKRMNPRARAEYALKLANVCADNFIRAMREATTEDILFKCSRDRLPELWDLTQNLSKILRDARGGKTGTDGT